MKIKISKKERRGKWVWCKSKRRSNSEGVKVRWWRIFKGCKSAHTHASSPRFALHLDNSNKSLRVRAPTSQLTLSCLTIGKPTTITAKAQTSVGEERPRKVWVGWASVGLILSLHRQLSKCKDKGLNSQHKIFGVKCFYFGRSNSDNNNNSNNNNHNNNNNNNNEIRK